MQQLALVSLLLAEWARGRAAPSGTVSIGSWVWDDCIITVMNTASIAAKTLLLDRIKIVFRSELALYTLAFFCLNLSFAQIDSYILLLRDYLGLGQPKQAAYIGVCIIFAVCLNQLVAVLAR